MSIEHYNAEEARERGRQTARWQQQDIRVHPEEWLIYQSPEEWQQIMIEYVESRDRLREQANQGNMAAKTQADYLDGYLSVWD